MNESTPLVRAEDAAAPEDPDARPRLVRRVTGVQSPREVSRADLLAQGQSSEEADRQLVRQNQQRLMHDLAMPLMGFWLFGTVVCGLVTFVLFIILLVRWIQYNSLEDSQAAHTCDNDLNFWISLAIGFHIYRVWKNWNRGEEEETDHMENCFMGVFDFGWKIVGLFWAYGAPKCAEYHPEFYAAFVHYVWFSLFAMVFVYGGLIPIVSVMLAVGAMQSDAAPEGTIEQCEWLAFNERFNGEVFPKSCPICMEDFDAERPIRQTPCQHVFHEECLREWFTRAKSCPLCRENVAKAVEGQTGPEAV